MINKPPAFPKNDTTYNHKRVVSAIQNILCSQWKKDICFPLSMLLYFLRNLISVGGQSKFNFNQNDNFPPAT